MNDETRNRLDRLLDLLTLEVAERLEGERVGGERLEGERSDDERAVSQAEGPRRIPPTMNQAALDSARTAAPPPLTPAGKDRAAEAALAPGGPDTDSPPEPDTARESDVDRAEPEKEPQLDVISSPPASHTARLLGRLAFGLLALVVVINIPFNRHGTTLATAMPDHRALVIRDGLLVKEEDDPEIYVFQDGRFRWISSLKAFEMRGYAWDEVHVVEDGFLEPYEIGPPIHVILKCRESPHIYRVEGEEKRWIVDIEAFEEAGHVWEDVAFVSCEYLRNLPDGETIPPGHGPPPQP